MAIITKSIIVNGQNIVKEEPAAPVAAPVIQRVVVETPPAPIVSSDQPVLIVDGKHKKVSKRSAYMLDMLTIEDEE